jgi:GT2 family glycosyltransferase
MNTPHVSICIPTYQRPRLLEEAVRSCLAQTFGDYEVVITDNSPNDDSREMLRQFTDPRIRYYRNETNLGSHGNAERVLGLARGRHIKWLMDDDLMRPRFLERTVAAMDKYPSVGIVMAPMDLIDEAGKRIFPRFYFFRTMHHRYRYRVGDALVDRKTILRDFLTRDYPCCVPSGILFRREFFDRHGFNDPATDFAGDLDLCMRAALHYDFYYVDQVLSSWRYFQKNHTATLHKKGLPVHVFYYITRKILNDPQTRRLFAGEDWDGLVRRSHHFCSCRALLNVMAGIRARSPKLIADTFRLVLREDPYWRNRATLPLWALREIGSSFLPPAWPPPAE